MEMSQQIQPKTNSSGFTDQNVESCLADEAKMSGLLWRTALRVFQKWQLIRAAPNCETAGSNRPNHFKKPSSSCTFSHFHSRCSNTNILSPLTIIKMVICLHALPLYQSEAEISWIRLPASYTATLLQSRVYFVLELLYWLPIQTLNQPALNCKSYMCQI